MFGVEEILIEISKNVYRLTNSTSTYFIVGSLEKLLLILMVVNRIIDRGVLCGILFPFRIYGIFLYLRGGNSGKTRCILGIEKFG